MYQTTTALKKICKFNKRIRGVQGGTGASKTVSINQWLIDYAQVHLGKTISIVSESMPHLKRGAMRDFLGIMQEHEYFDDNFWNKSDFIYHFDTRSIIEFFSVDQQSKVKGPRRDVLFINEANNISFETFTQLEVRTNEIIFLDWNPDTEFWWNTEIVPHYDFDFEVLTYRDNEALPKSIVQSIEAKQYNKNWWRVYGLGQLGTKEGLIYPAEWEIIDEVPPYASLQRYGLDFGYTNDPTAIVANYACNGGILFDEIAYQPKLKNRQIGEIFLTLPSALVIADSSEPKSIDEIKEMGINIIGATKGPGSILQGIQHLQDRKIFITKRSINLLREKRNYMWQTDKEGKTINVAQDFLNHLMDACRYSETPSIKPKRSYTSEQVGGLPWDLTQ